jgi:rod shape determining protein RodA
MGGKDWRQFDKILVAAFLMLCVIGSVEIYYSTQVAGESPYLVKHLLRIGIGLLMFLVVLWVDYRFILNQVWILYGLSLLVLIFVLFFGLEIHGSKSWLKVGGLTFQPSELVKLVVILALAKFLADHPERYLRPWPMFFAGLIALGPIGLIVLQHDLGTALTLMPVFFVLLLVAGIRKKVVALAALILLLLLGGSWFVLRDYQKERILVLADPGRDPKGTGYQTIQSVIAIGSGGFTGRGLGQGSQGALGFLPERHTDFIFAVVGEEMGFVGAVLVLLLYGTIFHRGLAIALETSDRMAMYASVGIVTLYGVHLLINVGMTLGLMPVIGIPLPPLSWGGSSVVTSFMAMGLLNNFRIHRYMV